MKFLIIPALLIFVLGCTLDNNYIPIMDQVHNEISYLAEAPGQDDWQLPRETEEKRTGDCEDIALLMLDRVWTRYHVAGDIICISFQSNDDSPIIYHAIAGIDRYYDPTAGVVFDKIPDGWKLEYSMTYWEARYVAAKR